MSGIGRQGFGSTVVGEIERVTKEGHYRTYSCMLVTRKMGFSLRVSVAVDDVSDCGSRVCRRKTIEAGWGQANWIGCRASWVLLVLLSRYFGCNVFVMAKSGRH